MVRQYKLSRPSARALLLSLYVVALPLSLSLYGCDDDTPRRPSREVVPAEDLGASAPDAAPEIADMMAEVPDAEVMIEDQWVPPPHLAEPRARVFLSDPISDDGELTEVVMRQTLEPDGRLTSDSVEVFNCLNEEGGLTGEISMGFTVEVSLCREEQVARPDADGHYLSLTPPEDYTDPNDSFAEVMMYHHVNEIADYYQERHSYQRYTEPLPALVNVQLKTNPPLPFEGLRPGPDGFIPLDNALFFPKESWEAFAQQFGLPPRDTDPMSSSKCRRLHVRRLSDLP